jgi:hypothetical protein
MGGERIRVFCRVRPSRRPSGYFALAPESSAIAFAVPDVEKEISNHARTRCVARTLPQTVG